MASAEFSRARRKKGTASREGLPDGEPESPSDNRPTQFSLLAALSMFAGPILGDLWGGPILQRQHFGYWKEYLFSFLQQDTLLTLQQSL